VPVEEVIGRVDDRQFLRLLDLRVELAQRPERTEFVPLALDEEFRLGARADRREIIERNRRRDAEQDGHAVVGGPRLHGNPGAEGEPGRPHRHARVAPGHEIERGPEVERLATAVVEGALARSHAAEVESQDRATEPAERLGRLEHDLRVHRAALHRERMGDHDGRAWWRRRRERIGRGLPGRAKRSRIVDECLEASRRAGDMVDHRDRSALRSSLQPRR
jgi:hypothetical protein